MVIKVASSNNALTSRRASCWRAWAPGSESWGEDDDSPVVFDANLRASEISAPRGDQRQYYIHVRDALTGKISNPVSPLEALAVMAVLEAAAQSAESGTTQTLALTADELAGLQ